jgi:four helix bundle protein
MNTTAFKIKDFTDLKTWEEGHKLVLMIYKITKSFPKDELYSLVDQMRRAVVSITSNVAEGFGRQGYKEKIQFGDYTQIATRSYKEFKIILKS